MSTHYLIGFTTLKVDPSVSNSLSLLAFLHYCILLVHLHFCLQFIIFRTYLTYVFTHLLLTSFHCVSPFTFSCWSVLCSFTQLKNGLLRFHFVLCANTYISFLTGKLQLYPPPLSPCTCQPLSPTTCSSTVIMEAAGSSETSVDFYQTTQHQDPEWSILTFIVLIHRILLNQHLTNAPGPVHSVHLNALYSHVEAQKYSPTRYLHVT